MIMKFAKSREVISPRYAHPGEDAGIDFFIPIFSAEFIRDLIKVNNTRLDMFDIYINDESVYKTLQLTYGIQGVTMHSDNMITIKPHCRVLLPSGIHVDVPKGRGLIANNKSGVCTKKGIIFGASTVDHGYQGEVHISLINTNKNNVNINENEKIIQFIMHTIDNEGVREVNLEDLYTNVSARNVGGFGHTM